MTATCELLAVEKLSGDVQRVLLRTQRPFAFKAGQYLNICHPDGTAIPFSIASAPAHLPNLELHFRPVPELAEADLVIEMLENSSNRVDIDGPFGDVWVDSLEKPLFVIAGGTGAAQANAILTHLGNAHS